MTFFERFSKNIEIPNFMETRPVGAEMFHADGWIGRQTDMTKLIDFFHNFANAPKKSIKLYNYNDE